MKKPSVFGILIAAVIYVLLFVLGAASGAIHPACFAYAGAVLPFLFSFIYLYTAAKLQHFGAAVILNGFVLIIGVIMGEGNPPLIIGMLLLALITEVVRGINGYDTLKGVRQSFIPFAFSYFAYTAHWWTDTETYLAEATEVMPAGYAEKMLSVIENKPVMILVLVLTIPAAILGMRFAEKVLKNQAAALK